MPFDYRHDPNEVFETLDNEGKVTERFVLKKVILKGTPEFTQHKIVNTSTKPPVESLKKVPAEKPHGKNRFTF